MAGELFALTGKDNIEILGAATMAIGALGTSAFALVDASKGLPGFGISALGFPAILAEMQRYDAALRKSLGEQWADVLKGQWVNGREAGEQKSVAISGIMLGLDPESARELTLDAAIDKDALAAAIAALAKGEDQVTEAHTAVLSRLRSILTMRIDAAFERAQQIYRNQAKLWAMACAILLALVAQFASEGGNWSEFMTFEGAGVAFLIGLMAVPVAPVAKDIAGGLSAAARALKLGR